MASNCVVEKKVVVSNDFKSNWVPETQEVEGMFFMKVSKWDRSFVRFCTGQALLFSGGSRQDINVSFLELLQRLRTTVVDEAVKRVLDDEAGARKAKRVRKARLSDRDLVPQVLSIQCPDVRRGDLLVPATHIQVLFGVKNSDLWVEATAPVLEDLRHGVLASMDLDQSGRKWKPKKRSAASDHPTGSDQEDASRGDTDDIDGVMNQPTGSL
jgi:hypothetical protein